MSKKFKKAIQFLKQWEGSPIDNGTVKEAIKRRKRKYNKHRAKKDRRKITNLLETETNEFCSIGTFPMKR